MEDNMFVGMQCQLQPVSSFSQCAPGALLDVCQEWITILKLYLYKLTHGS